MAADLLNAVLADDFAAVRRLLAAGADPNARDPASGLTLLMIAAGRSQPDAVTALLAAGADVFATDPRAGGTALHKASQGGNVEVARQLIEAGAFVDATTATTGHTPLIDAIWYKHPDLVCYLLDRGARLNVTTHYGFSLLDHLQYALKVNQFGQEKLEEADRLVQQRRRNDEAATAAQALMAAVVADDLDTVRRQLADGTPVDQRSPMLSGFNDDHTPLLVACRDGHTAIAEALMAAGADVNAVEPTFGAVPLHKAVYNGHADITALLVKQPGIDLDFQGATNGYTPLHDSLWHGFADCARVLIDAGARLDLTGHDGKTPLDMAVDVLGPDHEIVGLIRSKIR